MSLLSSKLCMSLLLVGICVVLVSAAPHHNMGVHAINPSDPPILHVPSENEHSQEPIMIPGNFNGEPVLAPLANEAVAADSQPESSSAAPVVLVRVRRNKHPIRYHDKSSVRRQL